MLAQPFIENSIEHGIIPKETRGHIDVTFSLKKDVIHIEVEDDGIGFKASSEMKKKSSKDHKSLAMKITKDRLMMMCKKYKKKYTFISADILDAEKNVSGAKVSFDVPYTMI
jgi:sensor histidine kinase YesM